MAVRMASATVGTATNWNALVYADATKSMKPSSGAMPRVPSTAPKTSAAVQIAACLNFIDDSLRASFAQSIPNSLSPVDCQSNRARAVSGMEGVLPGKRPPEKQLD